MSAAVAWAAWTDEVAFTIRLPAVERKVLRAIEQAQAHHGRRPRLEEIRAFMPPGTRGLTKGTLDNLIRAGRVARGVFDATSYRDTQEWRGTKRWR